MRRHESMEAIGKIILIAVEKHDDRREFLAIEHPLRVFAYYLLIDRRATLRARVAANEMQPQKLRFQL